VCRGVRVRSRRGGGIRGVVERDMEGRDDGGNDGSMG
jgi:hypothetical protein